MSLKYFIILLVLFPDGVPLSGDDLFVSLKALCCPNFHILMVYI